MSSKVFRWSLAVALSGFLFGFDTAVISGADQPIQRLWSTSSTFHSFFIMSMALWGTVIGALFGGIPTDLYGRKKVLMWIGILYLVSALGSAFALGPYSFSFFRFLGGIGVGASSVAAPTYIAEIAPSNDRGRLVALYQFNIVIGILSAFITNWLVGEFVGVDDWRLMLGLEAVPALFYCLMILGMPQSPRWLMLNHGSKEEVWQTLLSLDPTSDIEREISAIKESLKSNKVNANFFSGKYSFLILLAFLLAFFNQLSGINFVLYYAPRIFGLAGVGESAALLSTIGIGVTSLIFTYVGVYLIDRVGRRTLLIYGSLGYIITLAALAWGFKTGADGMLIVFLVFGFFASHAIGQGAVIWVFISEIFPNNVRASGQALGTGTHWVFAAIITLITLPVIDMLGNNPWKLFAFFAFMMILQLAYALFIMPETKGVSLEDLEKKLVKEKSNL